MITSRRRLREAASDEPVTVEESLMARPKDERRSTIHVIGSPRRISTTDAGHPAANLADLPPSASISARKTLASLARPLGTHRPPRPRGLISARKTLVPPKRHLDRSLGTHVVHCYLRAYRTAIFDTTQLALPLAPTVSAQRQRCLESST
jgi:hypothetical protein